MTWKSLLSEEMQAATEEVCNLYRVRSSSKLILIADSARDFLSWSIHHPRPVNPSSLLICQGQWMIYSVTSTPRKKMQVRMLTSLVCFRGLLCAHEAKGWSLLFCVLVRPWEQKHWYPEDYQYREGRWNCRRTSYFKISVKADASQLRAIVVICDLARWYTTSTSWGWLAGWLVGWLVGWRKLYPTKYYST